jgi:hypothetical protein
LKVPVSLLRLIAARPEATVFSTPKDIAALQIVLIRNVDSQAGGPAFRLRFADSHNERGCPILAFFARVGIDAAWAI